MVIISWNNFFGSWYFEGFTVKDARMGVEAL